MNQNHKLSPSHNNLFIDKALKIIIPTAKKSADTQILYMTIPWGALASSSPMPATYRAKRSGDKLQP